MNTFPIPLSILDKSSLIRQNLQSIQSQPGSFLILVGDRLLIDLETAGNLIVAGWSQSGKEQVLHSIIQSIMHLYEPEQARLIIYDGFGDNKHCQRSAYLLTEIIEDTEKCLMAFRWVQSEIDQRMKQFKLRNVNTLSQYNKVSDIEQKPHIVIVIRSVDFLIDQKGKEVETMLKNIVMLGYVTGIHVILATECYARKSFPLSIASQIPNKIVCQITTEEEERLLRVEGAMKLRPDECLVSLINEKAEKTRIISISDHDHKKTVQYLKVNTPQIVYEKIEEPVEISEKNGNEDPLFDQAVYIISVFDAVSASLLQRRLKIGYARAARLLDELEAHGYIGPANGSNPRKVLNKS